MIDKLFGKLGYHKTDDFWHNISTTVEVKKRGNQHKKWNTQVVRTYFNAVCVFQATLRGNSTISGWTKLNNFDQATIHNKVLKPEEIKAIYNN